MESVPNDKPDANLGVVARTTIAIRLIVAASAALAITRSTRGHLRATADVGPFDVLEVDRGPLRAQ